MARQRTTRPLTGRITWPFLLLAGGDKVGKTWSAIEASHSDLIGRTFYVPLGEDDADMYLEVGSDRLELVENDGTYRDFLDAVLYAVEQPRGQDGLPNLVIVDSGSELWDLLTEEQTLVARRRWEKKNRGKPAPDDDDLNITTDQWNVAKARWARVVTALRRHDGPAIITAKLEEVTVMQNGQPTTQKEWKVKAEKNLRHAVTGTILMREYRKAVLTGIRTTKLQAEPGDETRLPNFTFDSLWRALGLEDTANIERRQVNVTNAAAGADELEHAEEQERQSQQPPAMDLPDPDVVSRELREACDTENPSAALRAVGNKYGARVLARLTLTTSKGEQVNAAERIRQMIAHFDGPPAQPAQNGARAQMRAPEPEDARVEPAPEPEAPREPEQEERVEPAQQEEPAARQQRARQVAKAAEAKAADRPATDRDVQVRAMLLSEAEGQAEVLGSSLTEHLDGLMSRAPEGVTLETVPPLPLRNWVLKHRPQVVDALANNGHATAAEAYARADKGTIGWWEDLIGAKATVEDAHQEPAAAR